MSAEQQDQLREEFLALPREQWPGKAFRVIGEYMKVTGMTAAQPDKVWEDALASLKAVLLELGRPDIYKDAAEWLERTSKPYYDERRRGERAAKAALKVAAAKPAAAAE